MNKPLMFGALITAILASTGVVAMLRQKKQNETPRKKFRRTEKKEENII